jgi:hypothetical protein
MPGEQKAEDVSRIPSTDEQKLTPRKAGDGYGMDHGNPPRGDIKGSFGHVLA